MSDKCPNCNAVVMPGLVSCNSCGKPLKPADTSTGSFCSSCGNPLPSKYATCLNCGHSKTVVSAPPNWSPNQQRPPMSVQYKNEGTAILLAVVSGLLMLSGIGHMYIGRVGKGIGILIGSWIIIGIGFVTLLAYVGVVFFIIYLVIVIWQIFDVKTLCRMYNESLESNNTPPW